MSQASTPRSGPLAGIRVVDLTRVVMGPYATQILADQGAEVIAFEALAGDIIRNGPGLAPGLSGMAVNLMRGKRSVAVDLTTEEGHAAVMAVTRTADVLVTNMRPRALRKLGLDYDAMRAANESLIYCQAQGWPVGSEAEDNPAYDDVIQAATGAAALVQQVTGETGLMPTLIADKVCGLFIAQAVTAALVHRGRTGEGQHIDVPMTRAMTSFMLVEHGMGAMTEPSSGSPGYARILTPERRPAPTQDGFVHVLPYTPHQFVTLFTALGLREPNAAPDERLTDMQTLVASSDSLYRDVRSGIAPLTTAEAMRLCRELDIPVVEVASLDDLVSGLEVADHPAGGRYRVLPHPAIFSKTVIDDPVAAPLVGQDTAAVIEEVLVPRGS